MRLAVLSVTGSLSTTITSKSGYARRASESRQTASDPVRSRVATTTVTGGVDAGAVTGKLAWRTDRNAARAAAVHDSTFMTPPAASTTIVVRGWPCQRTKTSAWRVS